MKKIYTVEGLGKVTLDDSCYLAAGGEGSVYYKDGLAYKIYHDAKQMLPLTKIKELSSIKDDNVLRPKHIVYDSAVPVGYAMDYKKNTHPLCKLFTKAFKMRSGIANEDINSLIEKMQEIIEHVHEANCLIVDLNELNVLVCSKFATPYFIDTDSYQTKSHRATAVMENIRDRLVKDNHWTELSDWYSFGILACNMLLGIHPYKGSHPDYKPNEWQKRMEDGVSIFDPKASLPSVCNDFSVIPPSHLVWFKEIFLKNGRCKPPKVGNIAVIVSVPTAFNIITSSNVFETIPIETCIENIVDVFNFLGINYFIGTRNIHKGRATLPVEVVGYNKVLLCESENSPVICKLKDEIMTIETEQGIQIGNIAANDMMYRNGCVYSVKNGKLTENSFIQAGAKTIHANRLAGNVLDLATKVFDGVIFQDLLGRIHITLPYEKGKCLTMPVKELNGYRILDARSERNVVGVMAEKGGKYDCIVLTFNAAYNQYTIRANKDVPYSEINLTVLPNGIAVMANNTSVELFKGNDVKIIDNPPFNATTKLYNYSGSVHYVDGRKIFSTRMKK